MLVAIDNKRGNQGLQAVLTSEWVDPRWAGNCFWSACSEPAEHRRFAQSCTATQIHALHFHPLLQWKKQHRSTSFILILSCSGKNNTDPHPSFSSSLAVENNNNVDPHTLFSLHFAMGKHQQHRSTNFTLNISCNGVKKKEKEKKERLKHTHITLPDVSLQTLF